MLLKLQRGIFLAHLFVLINRNVRCKVANFVAQTQFGNDELALSQAHLSMLQALATNPENFLSQLGHRTLHYTPEEYAAIKLQAIWRGHSCRKKLGVRSHGVHHVRAAIQIQRIWRGHSTRLKSIYCARQVAKWNAAVAIQKV
jgi:hypothetical protein